MLRNAPGIAPTIPRMAQPRKPLLRALGEFFGHIRHGLKSDIKPRAVVRHETQERQEGNIVLRRTVIEEVEIHSDEPAPRKAP